MDGKPELKPRGRVSGGTEGRRERGEAESPRRAMQVLLQTSDCIQKAPGGQEKMLSLGTTGWDGCFMKVTGVNRRVKRGGKVKRGTGQEATAVMQARVGGPEPRQGPVRGGDRQQDGLLGAGREQQSGPQEGSALLSEQDKPGRRSAESFPKPEKVVTGENPPCPAERKAVTGLMGKKQVCPEQ